MAGHGDGPPAVGEAQSARLMAYAREIARHALGLSADRPPPPPDMGDIVAGAFVALRQGGALCGFVGSLRSRPAAEAVAEAAHGAATEDVRWDADPAADEIAVEVWLTGPGRPVEGPDEIDAGDGVRVAEGLNRAVRLPGLAGIGVGVAGLLSSVCVAADLHPKAWSRPSVTVTAFPVVRLDDGKRSSDRD